jgi:hypothetical protein
MDQFLIKGMNFTVSTTFAIFNIPFDAAFWAKNTPPCPTRSIGLYPKLHVRRAEPATGAFQPEPVVSF